MKNLLLLGPVGHLSDINIAENIRRTIMIRLECRIHDIKNRQNLIPIVKNVWVYIDSEIIKQLYESIPNGS